MPHQLRNEVCRFEATGIAGRVHCLTPDRFVHEVAVLELHIGRPNARRKDVWFVLFKQPNRIQALSVGQRICVRGVLDRALNTEANPSVYKPTAVFMWGESWEGVE